MNIDMYNHMVWIEEHLGIGQYDMNDNTRKEKMKKMDNEENEQ